MKRGTKPLKNTAPMERGTRLRPRSKKREQLMNGDADTEGRHAFRERILAERPVCQAGLLIGMHLLAKEGTSVLSAQAIRCRAACTIHSADVHEILARSAGGSIVEDSNVLAVCRSCHNWIGRFPQQATALGLRRSR